jgi:hypothetical protein
MRVGTILPPFSIDIRLKLTIWEDDRTPSRKSSSEMSGWSLIIPKEYIRFERMLAVKPCSIKTSEVRQRLPFKIESKIILIFFAPEGLMLIIPVKLIEKNLAD